MSNKTTCPTTTTAAADATAPLTPPSPPLPARAPPRAPTKNLHTCTGHRRGAQAGTPRYGSTGGDLYTMVDLKTHPDDTHLSFPLDDGSARPRCDPACGVTLALACPAHGGGRLCVWEWCSRLCFSGSAAIGAIPSGRNLQSTQWRSQHRVVPFFSPGGARRFESGSHAEFPPDDRCFGISCSRGLFSTFLHRSGLWVQPTAWRLGIQQYRF